MDPGGLLYTRARSNRKGKGMGNHNRPSNVLTVGSIAHTTGYERQGNGWNVYHLENGYQPLAGAWYPTAQEAHQAWVTMTQNLFTSIASKEHAAPEFTSTREMLDLSHVEDQP